MKFSFRERIRYRFENFMSKGGFSIFLSLFTLFILAFIVVLFLRLLVLNLEGAKSDFSGNMWQIFLELTDPGTMAVGTEASPWFKVTVIIGGILGLVIFSMLVAFITTQLEQVIWNFRKGRSRVVENNQTLILGWNERVLDIVRELIIANESEKKASIVILADRDKEEMDEEIHQVFRDTGRTKIITRKGIPSSLPSLKSLNASYAKSAIVLADCQETAGEEKKLESDAKVFKAVLALNTIKKNKDLHIVADLFYDNTRQLIKTFKSENIVFIKNWEILGKVLVQTSRTRGLSVVYNELFSFDGSEIYFYEGPWNQTRFYDLFTHFKDGIPLGVYSKDKVLLIRPDKETVLNPGDQVIIVGDDDSSLQYKNDPLYEIKKYDYREKRLSKAIEKELIIGWHPLVLTLIREYNDYLLEGSSINIMHGDLGEDIKKQIQDQLDKINSNLKVNIIDRNPLKMENLVQVDPFQYDNVIILSQDSETSSVEKSDSETLAILFMIRNMAEQQKETSAQTQLITQVLSSENEELVSQSHVDDFLISNKMLTMLFAQLSENPKLKYLYENLFSEEGSEIYLKPVNLYFDKFPVKIRFIDLIHHVFNRDEICLGYRLTEKAHEPEENFGVYVNPAKDGIIELNENDAIIVLSEDEL